MAVVPSPEAENGNPCDCCCRAACGEMYDALCVWDPRNDMPVGRLARGPDGHYAGTISPIMGAWQYEMVRPFVGGWLYDGVAGADLRTNLLIGGANGGYTVPGTPATPPASQSLRPAYSGRLVCCDPFRGNLAPTACDPTGSRSGYHWQRLRADGVTWLGRLDPGPPPFGGLVPFCNIPCRCRSLLVPPLSQPGGNPVNPPVPGDIEFLPPLTGDTDWFTPGGYFLIGGDRPQFPKTDAGGAVPPGECYVGPAGPVGRHGATRPVRYKVRVTLAGLVTSYDLRLIPPIPGINPNWQAVHDAAGTTDLVIEGFVSGPLCQDVQHGGRIGVPFAGVTRDRQSVQGNSGSTPLLPAAGSHATADVNFPTSLTPVAGGFTWDGSCVVRLPANTNGGGNGGAPGGGAEGPVTEFRPGFTPPPGYSAPQGYGTLVFSPGFPNFGFGQPHWTSASLTLNPYRFEGTWTLPTAGYKSLFRHDPPFASLSLLIEAAADSEFSGCSGGGTATSTATMMAAYQIEAPASGYAVAAVPCRHRSDDPVPNAEAAAAGVSTARDWFRCGHPTRVDGRVPLDLLVSECGSCGVPADRQCGDGRCPGYEAGPLD